MQEFDSRKETAREILRNNRVLCILIMLIPSLISVLAGMFSQIPLLGLVAGPAAFIIMLTVNVTMTTAFYNIHKGEAVSFENVVKAIPEDFARKLIGSAVMAGKLILWTLCLVIPGIIKQYSYAATPYLLGLYSSVDAVGATKLSEKIMRGHRFELFMLQVSFLGWWLLSVITGGIVGVVYAMPYYSLTQAGFITDMIDKAIAENIISSSDLVK
jgi:uncharacterized membrane protein